MERAFSCSPSGTPGQDHFKAFAPPLASCSGLAFPFASSPAVAANGYNDTMPIFSTTGHFEPKALDVLATSFVDTKLLHEKPDMTKLITEAYLQK